MTDLNSGVAAKRRAFRQLHESGCFVMPNPWDVGSARYLRGLGFKALATTSAGYAWSIGHTDGHLARDTVLDHMRQIVGATDLPVNADFENGFASDPDGVAQSVLRAIDTGVAGLSIEDATGDADQPIFDIDVAVARLKGARRAIDATGGDTLLIGRAENFWIGRPDLEDTVRRLRAYSEAGADVLYAPGIRTREEISTIVAAVAPKPVNLVVSDAGGMTLKEIADLGVRRISVGGALARSAWGGFMRAARAIANEGIFDGFADSAAGSQLNNFFRITVEELPTARSVRVVGNVEYREGDGSLLTVPLGPVVVQTTPADAVFSWSDGDSRGAAAMPIANFCDYVAAGAITVKV